MRHFQFLLCVFIAALSLSSCGSAKFTYPQTGSIILSQKASDIKSIEPASLNVLGFSQIPALFENKITLDLLRQTGIIESNGFTQEFNFVGKISAHSSQISLAFSQKNPLWYAPASYFESRKLTVPAEGSRLRYLKKALGEEAVFLSNGEAIFSSEMSLSDEISGIQVSEDTLKKLIGLSKTKAPLILK